MVARAVRRYVGRMSAKDIATKFEEAVGKKDYRAARKLLADDLSFVGPLDTFHDADAYVAALERLGALVEKIEVLRVLGEGDEAAVFCELHMKAPAPPRSFVAEWYKTKAGKITSLRIAFDARPFAAMFAHK
jgi:ketosteroid isomerase-like protein